MTYRWSDGDTLRLIELYKSFDFLWNKHSDLYKNYYARRQAYDEILEAMNIPKLTAQDVRCKIKNLRSAYYLELRRIKERNPNKAPMIWFHAIRPIMGNLDVKKEESVAASDSECSDDSPEVCDDSPFIQENSDNTGAYVVSIKQEYLDGMENQDVSAVEDCLEPVSKKARIYEQEPTKELKVGKQVVRSATMNKKTDEFQMFANNIAAQLRKLPLDRALNLQVEVQTLIAKERINIFKSQDEEDEGY